MLDDLLAQVLWVLIEPFFEVVLEPFLEVVLELLEKLTTPAGRRLWHDFRAVVGIFHLGR